MEALGRSVCLLRESYLSQVVELKRVVSYALAIANCRLSIDLCLDLRLNVVKA